MTRWLIHFLVWWLMSDCAVRAVGISSYTMLEAAMRSQSRFRSGKQCLYQHRCKQRPVYSSMAVWPSTDAKPWPICSYQVAVDFDSIIDAIIYTDCDAIVTIDVSSKLPRYRVIRECTTYRNNKHSINIAALVYYGVFEYPRALV